MAEVLHSISSAFNLCLPMEIGSTRELVFEKSLRAAHMDELMSRLNEADRTKQFVYRSLSSGRWRITCRIPEVGTNAEQAKIPREYVDALCEQVLSRCTKSPGILTVTAEELEITLEELYAVYVKLLGRDHACDWNHLNGQYSLTVYY